MNESWLTTAQIAAYFGFKPRWVRYRMREGMPHVYFGRQPRFRVSECMAWFESRQ